MSDGKNIQRIDIFISSPGDVQPEREAIKQAIERLNKQSHIRRRFLLNPLLWEYEVPPVGGILPQEAVDRYLGLVAEAEIFLCVLWRRLGTAFTLENGDHYESGTHYEIAKAFESRKSTGLPIPLTYRSENPIPVNLSDADDEQNRRLKSFLKRFGGSDAEFPALVGTFTDTSEERRAFEDQVFNDLDKIIDEHFIQEDATRPRGRADSYMHVPLPPNYVPRAALIADLRDKLFNGTKPVGLASGLQGMGGIGKSVMARALCDDPQVQASFPDGILWATLGQEADDRLITERMTTWIIALDGKIGDIQPSPHTLKPILADLLKDRACLLIVDDVWTDVQISHFQVTAPKCRLLLTTREGGIIRRLGSEPTAIPVMTEDEAVALLDQWAGGKLATIARETKLNIVRKLTRLPLAIKLAGGRLQSQSPEQWERDFDDLRVLDAEWDTDDPNKSLYVSFQLSLKALKERTRRLYLTLSIFREDEETPGAALERLWEQKDKVRASDVPRILDELADKALIELTAKYPYAVKLHDLLRKLVESEAQDSPQQTHTYIVEGYRKTQTGTGWHSAPHDGYLYTHLAYHLVGAGKQSELRAALLDYRYLRAKLDATDENALLADPDAYLNAIKPDKDEPIQVLRSALSMSAHVLREYPDGLGHQLVGRMMGHRKLNEEICAFTDSIPALQPGLYPVDFDSEYVTHDQAGGHLIRTLEGHTDSVKGVLLLDDGRILSWAGGNGNIDNKIRLWDSNGDPIATWQGHSSLVNGVIALSDGHFLSWSEDQTLRLWADDGSTLNVLRAHTNTVRGAIELGGGRILSWGDDRKLLIWNSNCSLLHVLEGHTNKINGAVAIDDGRLLSWSDDNTLRLWSMEGKLISVLAAHEAAVVGGLILPDGRLLSWSWDWTLQLWSSDGLPLVMLDGHIGPVAGVLLLPDGRFLSWDEGERARNATMRLWERDGTPLIAFKGHSEMILGAFALSKGRFLSWGLDDSLWLWNADGTSELVLEGHTGPVNGALSLDDSRILSWSWDGTLRLWDVNGNLLTTLVAHSDWIGGVLKLRNGIFLSWARGSESNDHTLRLWNIEGSQIMSLRAHSSSVTRTLPIKNQRVVSCAGNMNSVDYSLRIWNYKGELLASLLGHIGQVNEIIEFSDGRLLSFAGTTDSLDATLRMWQPNGDLVKVLVGHKDAVLGASILPDQRILSWSIDSTLRLWTSQGESIRTLTGHDGLVAGITYLTNGQFLSWASDGTIRLWNNDGEPLLVWNAPKNGDQQSRDRWMLDNRFSGQILFENHLYLRYETSDAKSKVIHFNFPEGSDIRGLYHTDAEITRPEVLPDNTTVVGDATGRVLFLRYRAK